MAKVQPPIVPIRLFRYRSLTDETLDREIESIRNNYVHCAVFTQLNDPMEGFYQPSETLRGKADYKETIRQITNSKSAIGIACFTENNENGLMWAHYAGNYTGMCLAYSASKLNKGLPDSASLVRLAYVDEPPSIFPSTARNAKDAAIRILSQKKSNWAYEREWRVLTCVGRKDLGKVQAVQAIYFGSRINHCYRKKILTLIRGTKIKAYMMRVDGYSHSFNKVPSVELAL